MTDKLTEALRAKCEEIANELGAAEMLSGPYLDCVSIIAPLVQSLRDEVIEECANTHKCKLLMSPGATKPCKELGLKGTELCSECRYADTIRALKGVR